MGQACSKGFIKAIAEQMWRTLRRLDSCRCILALWSDDYRFDDPIFAVPDRFSEPAPDYRTLRPTSPAGMGAGSAQSTGLAADGIAGLAGDQSAGF